MSDRDRYGNFRESASGYAGSSVARQQSSLDSLVEARQPSIRDRIKGAVLGLFGGDADTSFQTGVQQKTSQIASDAGFNQSGTPVGISW